MEDGEMYQDFLREYQLLLENEKRRLNPVPEKCNNVTETLEHGNYDIASAIHEASASAVEDNQLSEIVVVKDHQGVHESPEDAKCDDDKLKQVDNHKRREMMEQWITDSFYTSFPSFRKQDRNANQLADDRREDYRRYLAEVSNKKLLDADAVRGNRRRTESHSDSELMFSKPPETPRDKLLFDLKRSEIGYNFHSPDAVDDRNQKVAMERARRKVELQQELIKQIEEKKLQIEKIRAKEKEEDELLQRRLDNQMKALRMADELWKTNNEKVLITNPINRTHATNTVPRRNTERHTDEFKAEDNSPASENRFRNDVNANSDRQIYKFFSNSAPHHDGHLNYYNQPAGFNNNMSITNPYLHHISTAAHNPAQHCNRCRRIVPMSCSSCCHNEPNVSYFCCYQCNLLQNIDSCHNNCRRVWMPSWDHHYGVGRHRDNRPQILEITYQDHSSQTNNSTAPASKSESIQAMRPDSPDTSRNLTSNQTQPNNHPTLTHSDKMVGIGTAILPNIPESVSLSKEDEIQELKRKNDMLIAKYARNYGSLRNHRKSLPKETTTSTRRTDPDSFPLPLMREHLPTTSFRAADAETRRHNSQAVRQLEYKWEIPVVQRQVITNKPAKVLTQVGAIAKQLQLEKLNFSH